MFPIRDHNPSEKTPYVTFALIALNVAVFLYGEAVIETEMQLRQLYYDYAMVPFRLSNGENLPQLVTHMFLHGGFMHLAGNMLFLWIFGDNMEEELGHLPFLGFYILSGIAAALLQYWPTPQSAVPMVGASGAIAGVMGGYLLMFPKARVDVFIFLVFFFRILPIPAYIVLGIWMTLQVFNGLGSDIEGGGTAYWAHVGGFVAGFALTVPLWLRRGATRYWVRTEGHPPHPETRHSKTNIPIVRRRRR